MLILILVLVAGCTGSGLATPSVATASVTPATTATVASLDNQPQPTATAEPDLVANDNQAPDPLDNGVNLLLAVSGDVLLRRFTWIDYQPTTFGTALQRGDLLKLNNGAEALVLCDNLSLWRVPSGPAPAGLNGCPRPDEPALVRREVRIARTRGGDANVPYIISPRATRLLSPTPMLRWHAIPAAGSYLVQLRGDNLEWTIDNITGSNLQYPGDPPLLPGVVYLLEVRADTGSSSQDEGAKGLGFTILSDEEAAAIEAIQQQITSLDFSNEARQYTIAHHYANNGLLAEAIEILEAMIAEGSDEANVHQTLAELYTTIGLYQLAQERYLASIDLAEIQNNTEVLAAGRAGLGRVAVELGQIEVATEHLTAAQTDYEKLGEAEKISELEELLDLLQ